MTLIRMKMHDPDPYANREVPIEDRLDDKRIATKATPREFGGDVEVTKTLFECVYCHMPMFKVRNGSFVDLYSCATPMCKGNQDTPIKDDEMPIKWKVDENPVVRHGVWRL